MTATLPPRVARWLHLEQHVNERIHNPAIYAGMAADASGVLPPYRPETGGAWKQDYLLAREARAYGPVREKLASAFGLRVPPGKVPLFVHPQSRALFGGKLHRSNITVRPTASSRSLVAQAPGHSPQVLKAGIDCLINTRWRGFEEQQITRALVISRLLESTELPPHLDWFREVCGAATDVAGRSQGNWPGTRTSGWLLRELPRCLTRGTTTLVPLFSLVSHVDGAPSQLERMIARARQPAATFVVERIITPLVRAYAHLALVEGLFGEMHSQNVLYEVDRDGMLTGHLVIRDLTDMFLNIPLRVAQGRPLPALPRDLLPPDRPLELAWVATDAFIMEWTGRTHQAHMCICTHGMQGSIFVLHRALRRAHPELTLRSLKTAYLKMWHGEVLARLGLDAAIQPGLAGLPFDEAVAAYLGSRDWRPVGQPCKLPTRKGLRRISAAAPAGTRALAIDTPWGEIFVVDGVPAWLRPAF